MQLSIFCLERETHVSTDSGDDRVILRRDGLQPLVHGDEAVFEVHLRAEVVVDLALVKRPDEAFLRAPRAWTSSRRPGEGPSSSLPLE